MLLGPLRHNTGGGRVDGKGIVATCFRAVDRC